jgi:hypothetical protein
MSLFLPDLQKFFLQATAEVVYWRCSLINWIKSSLGIILHENAKTIKPEDHPMWPQEFIWFFAIFHQEFRQANCIAFEVLMMLAFAHFFGGCDRSTALIYHLSVAL